VPGRVTSNRIRRLMSRKAEVPRPAAAGRSTSHVEDSSRCDCLRGTATLLHSPPAFQPAASHQAMSNESEPVRGRGFPAQARRADNPAFPPRLVVSRFLISPATNFFSELSRDPEPPLIRVGFFQPSRVQNFLFDKILQEILGLAIYTWRRLCGTITRHSLRHSIDNEAEDLLQDFIKRKFCTRMLEKADPNKGRSESH